MRLQSSVSGRAERDLGNQYRWYLDNANLEVAERFLTAFDATVQRLAELPGLGRLRKFRSPELVGIRSLAIGGGFGAHLIFYRADATDLYIERIMHGARDLEKRLVEPPENYPTA